MKLSKDFKEIKGDASFRKFYRNTKKNSIIVFANIEKNKNQIHENINNDHKNNNDKKLSQLIKINSLINVGSGQELQIKKFAEIINKLTLSNKKLRFNKKFPDGTKRKILDISILKKIIKSFWEIRDHFYWEQ